MSFSEQLLDAMGDVGIDLVERAEDTVKLGSSRLLHGSPACLVQKWETAASTS